MVTKRQLGVAISAAGLLVVVGIVAVDFIGAGRWRGFGPLQRIGIGACLAIVGIGLPLVRLGNRPA